jgi:VWFA-related protein
LRLQRANPVLSPHARTLLRRFLALFLNSTLLSIPFLSSSAPAVGQTAAGPTDNPGFTIRSRTELVVVNVTARDRNGNMVKDLKAEDFTVLEENKPQPIASFDIESTDAVALPEAAQVQLLRTAPAQTGSGATPATASDAFRNHRLIVLFFDLSSMEPDEIDHAAQAGLKYVDKQMAPADLVSVVSLGNSLQINQDFTADHALLTRALRAFTAGSSEGFDAGSTGATEGTADTAAAFTADDTEFNIFNTDRRLQAVRSVAQSLAKVDQKKSLIYFSGGIDRTGIENQSQLRAAINAAVKANLAIYAADIRGLQAIVPGGEAQSASLRGSSVYSGRATVNAFDSNATSQETLVSLSGDTGGRAFLDSNDFGKVFTQVQQDTASYYVLGYHSTNPLRDGRFRRITVKINRPGLKLEYRKGYYAPADFQHSTQDDRERQLTEELASDLPNTDLPVFLAAGYFRMNGDRFYVPISLLVPGSEIPFTSSSEQDKATLDVIGEVIDENKRPAGQLRDTVKLAVSTSQAVRSKNVQYNNGFTLTPGKYHIKFVLRENQTGRLGSFETDLTIPEFKSVPVKMSSVILASQLQPVTSKRKGQNPLVRDGSELIPSVTRVFSSGQHLYLYFEVYDPAKPGGANDAKAAPGTKPSAIRLLTNVSFLQGNAKTYETPLVEADDVNTPDRHAAAFQLDVPLSQLKPGFYTCQVNVVDDAAGHFTFPRLTILIRPQ